MSTSVKSDRTGGEAVAVAQEQFARALAIAVEQLRAGYGRQRKPFFGQFKAGVAGAHRGMAHAHVRRAGAAQRAFADDGIAHAAAGAALAFEHHQFAGKPRLRRKAAQFAGAAGVAHGHAPGAQHDEQKKPREEVARRQRQDLIQAVAHARALPSIKSPIYHSMNVLNSR